MKKLILILLLFPLISLSAQAQGSNLSKKEIRQMAKLKQKEAEEKQRQTDIKITSHLIKNQRYILMADEISNRYGNRLYVNRMLNFVLVDSINAIIQVGDNHSIGSNGVGGFTIDGRITKYEVKKNEKKKSYYISFWVQSPGGSFDVSLNISESGYTSASVSSATMGGRLSYYGKLEPIQKRKIYKGNSL